MEGTKINNLFTVNLLYRWNLPAARTLISTIRIVKKKIPGWNTAIALPFWGTRSIYVRFTYINYLEFNDSICSLEMQTSPTNRTEPKRGRKKKKIWFTFLNYFEQTRRVVCFDIFRTFGLLRVFNSFAFVIGKFKKKN